jgi:hypothetical protein
MKSYERQNYEMMKIVGEHLGKRTLILSLCVESKNIFTWNELFHTEYI